MEAIYCQGCGAEIQTEDKSKIGYAPPTALEREEVICKRCFRLKHYNEVQDVDMGASDFLKILDQISSYEGTIVNVVDIFDVHGSFIPSIHRLVGNKPVILIGNKVDLLPKSTNLNKVKQWMRKVAKDFGIQVQDIFLVSSVKGTGMNEVAFELEKIRKGKDIYVVGCTNVGKSTFINYLISKNVENQEVITTSYFPGTTLGFIDIPLDETSSMIDTPGVVNAHQMAHLLSDNDLKVVTPKKEIKPRVYQLNQGQTLYIGGLARIDIDNADEKHGYICYFSNELTIHRTKQENADRLYEDHLGEMLSPPGENTLRNWPELEAHTFTLNSSMDVVISGLGWVKVPEKGVRVKVYAPKGVKVMLRDPII
ncbi:ribosome biogenesis GTPase YqeH [Halalkalibacillus sediminis]|uniref:Ribosome biogenesis GTPase YqeH n=1 Tax=Halalkalibacillus sediminis TaxID=2018042 RepID=A0A2I0QXK4_9BACI|nr:ribosome biogenesis GTPase YqeH [Halalkalibacillus sediminis]PKR79062.1 ribosome biogenesis GTPase YqeH [Halalkalibacillus sediminis]